MLKNPLKTLQKYAAPGTLVLGLFSFAGGGVCLLDAQQGIAPMMAHQRKIIRANHRATTSNNAELAQIAQQMRPHNAEAVTGGVLIAAGSFAALMGTYHLRGRRKEHNNQGLMR